jgi:adenosylcobinamide kinase/adenosylcobinamide-phosphate guanylyltransferase
MNEMGDIRLILGGARSGKSRFAQTLAQQLGGDDVVFVATAEPRDEEMSRRISLHHDTRNPRWRTLEAATMVAQAIDAFEARPAVMLIDCLTLLVSNVLFASGDEADANACEQAVAKEVEQLLETCRRHPGTTLFVSGEVGLGLVPESAIGRLYRDLLGSANQRVATHSSATYLLVAGIPIDLKQLALQAEWQATWQGGSTR